MKFEERPNTRERDRQRASVHGCLGGGKREFMRLLFVVGSLDKQIADADAERKIYTINTTEQSSEALTAVSPNPNPKAWLNGLRFGCITRELGIPPKMSSWRFGRNSSFLFSPHQTPARRAQEWRHAVPA